MTPRHVLLFLVPILLLYELGLLILLTSADGSAVEDIRARRLLALVFQLFGAPGLTLAPLLALAVLAIQHLVRRDPLFVRLRVLPLMALESLAWALPLFVLGQLVYSLFAGVAAPPQGPPVTAALQPLAAAAPQLAAAAEPAWLPLARDVVRAAGAGIYEELVFRLAGITLIHLLLADVLRLNTKTAAAVALGATSLAFAFYHDLTPAGAPFDFPLLAFYTFAGLYFGIAFITRGFGVAVGLHFAYDLLAFSSQA